jgi:hypothetical protein
MPFDGREEQGRFEAFEKIDRVIDLLATPDRWCKGALLTRDGRRCIVGAMQAANAVAVLRRPVLQAIREVTGASYRSIEFFNDSPATTHAMVLTVLSRARTAIAGGAVAWEPAPPARNRMRHQLRTLFAWHRVLG